MPSHGPHSEEDCNPDPDWEWIGSDGLTDSERHAYAEEYRLGPGRDLTPEEINALRSLGGAGMLTEVKLEELPG